MVDIWEFSLLSEFQYCIHLGNHRRKMILAVNKVQFGRRVQVKWQVSVIHLYVGYLGDGLGEPILLG